MSACHGYQLLMELVAQFLTDFVFFVSCFLTDAISPLLLIQKRLIPTSRLSLGRTCRALHAAVMKIPKYQTPGLNTQDTIQQVRAWTFFLVVILCRAPFLIPYI